MSLVTARTRARWLVMAAAMAVTLALLGPMQPAEAQRALGNACPADDVPPSEFLDVEGSTHEEAIDCLRWYDITRGVTFTRFAPSRTTTRGQLATFVANLVERAGGDLPEPDDSPFTDVEGSTHASSINRLAEADIVQGYPDGAFRPNVRVTRGQTATYLVEAHAFVTGDELTSGEDFFPDDDGTTHEDSINALAALEVIVGFTDGTVRPSRPITRGQMASFIMRHVDILVEAGLVEVPLPVAYWLTILHMNDGESRLINAGSGLEEFGGIARFKTVVDELRDAAADRPDGESITISSGDNFLAGPEFTASLEKGVPFYDSIGLDLVGFDAMTIGNHEFDFGPDVLADFIEGFSEPRPPFLSANLDFSDEPRLQALVEAGDIAPSTLLDLGAQQVGVVGATTELLRAVSSPRNVQVGDVATAVQAEIDALRAEGADTVILSSHLQDIQQELDLVPQLSGLDVVVGGGGDELLVREGQPLIPGDEEEVFGTYPLTATNADGTVVPLVTTSGDYRYVGNLVLGIDAEGSLVTVDTRESRTVRVSGTGDDAVLPDPEVLQQVTEPVQDAIADLAATVVASSEVGLDGRRSTVRQEESNLGNLLADGQFWVATELADDFGVPEPDVALQNGGGIRNDTVIPAGTITELDTFSVAPFSNFVSIVPDIPRDQFKEILENAVSNWEGVDGRFPQVSGFSFTWEQAGTAQQVDDDGNVLTPGDRIVDVELDDGTQIVDDGTVVDGPALSVATIDFLARGGDQYPFRGADFTTLGVTYQQALRDYLVDELGGTVTASDYPEGGEGRIVKLD